MRNRSPIVVLDSGLGGLTVVRALRERLPGDDLVYFGDTARLPYGSKTAEVVQTFVIQIIRYLLPLEPKQVVIACNTATALALPEVRAAFPELAIAGVIEPGAEAAVEACGSKENPRIGVIATEATVRSGAYEKSILRRRAGAEVVMQAAPLLVPIIEDGRGEDDPLVQLALKQYLAPMRAVDAEGEGLDVLVLGCTHYPILKGVIQRMVGPGVKVVDSADRCAEDVSRRLVGAGLASPGDRDSQGSLQCWVTDDGPKFARLASRFLGYEIPRPAWVSPDDLPTSSPADAMRRVG